MSTPYASVPPLLGYYVLRALYSVDVSDKAGFDLT